MIDLRRHRTQILDFFESGLVEFRHRHPDVAVGHVALYCCPWVGWVSLCIDQAVQLRQNCPDFGHVEVAIYEANDWPAEYESEGPLHIVTANGEDLEIDIESEGDEALNAVFFEFLGQLLANPAAAVLLRTVAAGPVRVGVQLLDSEFSDSWWLASRTD